MPIVTTSAVGNGSREEIERPRVDPIRSIRAAAIFRFGDRGRRPARSTDVHRQVRVSRGDDIDSWPVAPPTSQDRSVAREIEFLGKGLKIGRRDARSSRPWNCSSRSGLL